MIDAFYEVDYIKPFDRNESYYSHYYKYCLIKPFTNVTHYNIAINPNKETRTVETFLILYEEPNSKAIKIKHDVKGWWKINFGDRLPHKRFDYNIKLEYVESRDNPACHIYRVSVN